MKGTNLVQPGDILRYTLSANNLRETAAKNLVLTQPIPAQTTYQLNSALAASGVTADITYSIDGGQTFGAEPMVEVVQPDGSVELAPALAEAYTHICWAYGDDISAEDALASAYIVQVK